MKKLCSQQMNPEHQSFGSFTRNKNNNIGTSYKNNNIGHKAAP